MPYRIIGFKVKKSLRYHLHKDGITLCGRKHPKYHETNVYMDGTKTENCLSCVRVLDAMEKDLGVSSITILQGFGVFRELPA